MMDYDQDFTVQNGVLKKYNGSNENVLIPKGVTKIDGKAFYNCTTLSSVTIPEGVEEIGRNAFYKCEKLSCISIPESLTKIVENPFAGCTRLQEFQVYPKNSVFCAEGAMLLQKDENILLACPSAVGTFIVPAYITKIGDHAFSGCTRLTDIFIPDSVSKIGDYAFFSCTNLLSITLSEGLQEIGESSFSQCVKLTSVTIPESIVTIGRSAFDWCSGLSNINIPDGITKIGQLVFNKCTSLTAITIPKSVTEIGNRLMRFGGAFDGCANLKEIVVLSESMKEKIEHCFPDPSENFYTYEDTTLEVEAFESKDCFSHTVMLTDDSILIAPNMPISSLSKKLLPAAIRGFAKWNNQGKQYSEDQQAEYIKYIKGHRKRLYDVAIHNDALLHLMLSEKMVPKNDILGLIDKASGVGDESIVSMLLEYQEENLPNKSRKSSI